MFPLHLEASDQIKIVQASMADVGLSLSDAKTEVSKFRIADGGLLCDKPLQYLGFTFDWRKTLIRQSSLNRYYAKMKSGVLAKVLAAHRKGVPPADIYMRELFRKYTHFGKHRNFPRYAYRAAEEMSSPEIRWQISNHFEIFKQIVRLSIQAVY